MNNGELLEQPIDRFQRQIDTLNDKFDRILEELEVQHQRDMALEDLRADLMRVGNDVYKAAIEGLGEYADTVNGRELQQLIWNLARNLQSINKVVLQMESAMTFFGDSSPIVRQIIIDLSAQLDEWDRKGYFTTLHSGYNELGNLLQKIDAQDIRSAGRIAARMIDKIKEADWSRTGNSKIGYMELFREMRSPEVKKGLAFIILLMKTLAGPAQVIKEPSIDNNEHKE